MNEHLTRYEVEQAIHDSAIDCLTNKCVTSDKSFEIKYISPQELIEYLPKSLRIDRAKHVTKHHGGQWEIRNKYIHCYLGFQVINQNNQQLISLLKHLQKRKAEAYRSQKLVNSDNNQSAEHNNDENSDNNQSAGHNNDEFYDVAILPDDCAVCGRNKTKIRHAFGKHICIVSGYFKCGYYKCAGRTFKVGICLLDPDTKQPPTRYKCSICGYVATFIRYDFEQNQNTNSKHRSDLCEACDIWGNCQQPFFQPLDISQSLWNFYGIESEWKMNKEGDAICCSFSMYDENGTNIIHYQFEIKPYVKCTRINSKVYFAGNSSPTDKHDGFTGSEKNDDVDLDDLKRSQKYEDPPPEPALICFNCGEEGHFAQQCQLKGKDMNNMICYNCGNAGHFARDCKEDFNDEYDENNDKYDEYNEEYDENNDEYNDDENNDEYDENNDKYDENNDENNDEYDENNDENDDEYNDEYDDEYNEEYDEYNNYGDDGDYGDENNDEYDVHDENNVENGDDGDYCDENNAENIDEYDENIDEYDENNDENIDEYDENNNGNGDDGDYYDEHDEYDNYGDDYDAGHNNYDAGHNNYAPSNGKGNDVCYLCQGIGHWAINCPTVSYY